MICHHPPHCYSAFYLFPNHVSATTAGSTERRGPVFAPVRRCVGWRERRRVTIAAHAFWGGFGRISEEFRSAEKWAGEKPGVVKPPDRTLLPAVRAVAEGFEGSRKQGKSWANGVVNAKKPLNTAKIRGLQVGLKIGNRIVVPKDKLRAWINANSGSKTGPL